MLLGASLVQRVGKRENMQVKGQKLGHLPKHEGACTSPICCINCKGSHSARYKECETYKKEMAAVEKAHAEHLSIGQAKRL